MSAAPALQVQGLTRHFGGVKALHNLDLTVNAGECLAMIGPNGAGKSTCFACLAGQQVADAGLVLWRGHSLLGLSPAQRLHLGVTRTFQVAQLFDGLTVLQNIQLVLTRDRLSWLDRLARRHVDRAQALLSQVGLLDARQLWAGQLAYGQRKRLELAMALAALPMDAAGRTEGLLLLDEPAAGLSQVERADMMGLVRSLARQGATVLYTEHHMDAVLGVADRVLVLMRGERVVLDTPEEVMRHARVKSEYLGTSPAEGGHA